MPMTAREITEAITAALPGAVVELRDLAGDDDHWAATVTAPQFAGLSRVAQHKLVYNALGFFKFPPARIYSQGYCANSGRRRQPIGAKAHQAGAERAGTLREVLHPVADLFANHI